MPMIQPHAHATDTHRHWLTRRCAKVYERHKRTIDEARHTCGICRSRLRFQGKFARDGRLLDSSTASSTPVSQYGQFMKERFGSVKKALPPGTPHGTVMKALSQQWQEHKQQSAVKAAVGGGGAGVQEGSGESQGGSAGGQQPAETPAVSLLDQFESLSVA